MHPKDGEFFSVDTALLSELGEKMVPTPHLALSELIKNSYDADATEVIVTISYDGDLLPVVEIEDNGSGMTLDQIRSFWMRIGTNNKADNPVSPKYGRRKTGAKGIGRFSTRRLGRRLSLTSRAVHSNGKVEHTELEIDWGSAEFAPGNLITEVPIYCEHKVRAGAGTGLKLKISAALEDEWNARGFGYLQRQLGILAANRGTQRKGYEKDPGFQIILHAPDLTTSDTTDIREEVINAGWATLEAKVDDKGRAICTLVGENLSGKQRIVSHDMFIGLNGTKLKLGILVDDPRWIRNKQVLSKYSIQEITGDWGGVQIRYLGFRILPYGERGNDWLHIDKDRGNRHGKTRDAQLFDFAHGLDGVDPGRALLNLLSNSSFLGEIEINEKMGLEPKADRMGFMENETFRKLQEFARFAIDWAMILRDYAIKLDANRITEESRVRFEESIGQKGEKNATPSDATRALKSAIKEIRHYVPEDRQAAVNILERSTDYLALTLKEQTTNLRRLQLVASSASLALFFHHEIKSLMGSISAIEAECVQLAEKLNSDDKENWLQMVQQIRQGHSNMNDLMQLTSLMGAGRKKEEASTILLRPPLEQCAHIFRRITDHYNISFEGIESISPMLGVGPMLKGELMAMLINALSNAVKAVIAGDRDRQIKVDATREAKMVKLSISDTGIGLDEDLYESVFTPLVTDPSGKLYNSLEGKLNGEDLTLLGEGSGLGLSILKSLVEYRRGKISFVTPEPGWSTKLQILIP